MTHARTLVTGLFFSAFTAFSQTYQPHVFKTVPFGGGGCSTGVITCPTQKDLIFVRTDMGGAFRWIEAEKGWKSLHFAAPKAGLLCTESLAVDPSSPNRVYIVAGEVYFDGGATTLMRSVDYGDTWEYIDVTAKFKASSNAGGQKGSGERLMVDPNKGNVLYYGSRATGLWKSTDYGTTWNKVTTFPVTSNSTGNGVLFVDFLAEQSAKGQESQILYAGISRTDKVAPVDSANIYISYDAGKEWLPLSAMKGSGTLTPPANLTPQHTAYADGKIYVTYGDAKKACLWRFDLYTDMWEDISPADNLPISGVAIDSRVNPTTIALTTNSQYAWQGWVTGVNSYGDDFFRGKIDANGKITWDKRMINAGLAKFDMNSDIINGGLHWAWDVEIDPFNKNRIFITSGNGIYSSDNFTATPSIWYYNVKNLEQTITMDVASVPGGKFMLALGDISGGVYSDFTQKCIRFNPSQAVTNSVDYSPVSKMLIRSGSNRMANGVQSTVMTSDKEGVLWTGVAIANLPLKPALPNPLTSKDAGPSYGCAVLSADGTTIAYSFYWEVNDVRYYGTYYTRDRGNTWTPLPSSEGVNTMIIADKVDPNAFYLNNGTSICYYNWNGTTYDLKTYPLPSTSMKNRIRINPLVAGEFLGWVGGSSLYLFSDHGAKSVKLSIPNCVGAGWGKPAPGRTNPTIFAYGKASGETINRVYRTDDYGATWVRISDNNAQFGGLLNKDLVVGDMNVYGRVYYGNPGIGLIYADIASSSAIETVKESGRIVKISSNISDDLFTVYSEKPTTYRILTLSGTVVETGKFEGAANVGNLITKGVYLVEFTEAGTNLRQVDKLIRR